MNDDKCRICQSPLAFLFEKQQLNKYLVKYFQCTSCFSAQTENPYWLTEAYENFTFRTDTGMVERSIQVANLTLALAIEEGFNANDLCIDVGGGTGLLTRILRDHGLNAYWNDRYAQNIFALGFEKELSKHLSPKLLTAFEVFEHFPNPQEEVQRMLESSPEFVLFSTKLYHGQDVNWWYFLNDGQHIQFYSQKGLQLLANSWGYHFSTIGNTFHVFSKKPKTPQFLKKVLKKAPEAMTIAKKRWRSRTIEDHVTLISERNDCVHTSD